MVENHDNIGGNGLGFKQGHEGFITYWPSEEFEDEEPNFEEWAGECTSLIMVEDLGEQTGGRHWHYYFRLKKQARLKKVQEWVTGDSEEAKRVSIRQIISLDGVFKYLDDKKPMGLVWKEYGIRKKFKTGSSNELLKVCHMIDKGKSNYEIAVKHQSTWVVHHKGIRDYRNVVETRKFAKIKQRPIESWIFWGSTGKGKTTDALYEFLDVHKLDEWDYYMLSSPKTKNNVWFNGYDGQKVLVLDEFDETWMSMDMFKKITDKWIHLWESKGGMVHGIWEYIIMTSNYNPKDWWDWDAYPSIKRRVSETHWIDYRLS